MNAFGLSQRCLNFDFLDSYVTGSFISQKSDEFFDQQPKGWRWGVLIPKHGDFVGNQWVVGNMDSHDTKSTGLQSHPSLSHFNRF